MKTRINI
jgi:hypothetical protein